MGIDRELRTRVRASLEEFAAAVPGRSVEIRIPPYAAIQAVSGTTHRRGTPPAVVETDAETWFALMDGTLSWVEAVASGSVRASGERSDLGPYFPGHRDLESPNPG